MERAARTAAITILVFAMLTSTLQVGTCSAAEPPSDMPLVYVDPPYAFADVDTTFNVSVKIFNLTDTFYGASAEWEPGEPLPPPGVVANYSLGNLYGFNLSFSWDPTVLTYIGHSVRSPVEEYPDGVLFGPVWEAKDEVNSTTGTYSVAAKSWPYPVACFNTPNRTATVFNMAFRVQRAESHRLRLGGVELWVHPVVANEPGVREVIPHQTMDGVFRPVSTTRIASVEIGALVEGRLHDPIIVGEDATIRVNVANYGPLTNSYNLTLLEGAKLLAIWEGASLAWGQTRTFSYALETRGLGVGSYSIVARACIEHNGSVFTDSLTQHFTIINIPLLRVTTSPNKLAVNDTVTLNAGTSVHQDPNSSIVGYHWLLYEPNATLPTYTYDGVTTTHTFDTNGTWLVELRIIDNWEITYSSSRNATLPYRKELLLEIPSSNNTQADPLLTQEQIIMILAGALVASVIIAYAVKKTRS